MSLEKLLLMEKPINKLGQEAHSLGFPLLRREKEPWQLQAQVRMKKGTPKIDPIQRHQGCNFD